MFQQSQNLNESKPNLLKKCKEVIRELTHELNAKLTQNQQFKQRGYKHQKQIAELSNALQQKQSLILQITHKNESLHKEIILQRQRMTNEINQLREEYNSLIQQNLQLKHRINAKESVISQYQKENIDLTNKYDTLSETVHLINVQNNFLRKKCLKLDQDSKNELDKLKEINEAIKRKISLFDTVDNYSKLNNENYDLRMNSPLIHRSHQKQFRSQSTNDKKLKNETESFKKSPKTKDKSYLMLQTHKNPQMIEELSHLKRQISEQYSKVELRRESFGQERISKTLEAIQKKLNKMVNQAEKSSNQSQMQ